MITTPYFVRYEASDWAELAQGEPFLLDGLVHGVATAWYGRSKTGKSRLVCNMVTSLLRGRPFLDREPTSAIGAVAIYAADVGGVHEYAQRLSQPHPMADAGDVQERIHLIRPRGRLGTEEAWDLLNADLADCGADLVILDPGPRIAGGSVNDDEVAIDFWSHVDRLGIPAVVIFHATNKSSVDRRGSPVNVSHQTIMGSAYWESSARWLVEMRAEGGSGVVNRLQAFGNAAPMRTIDIAEGDGLTEFVVTQESCADEAGEAGVVGDPLWQEVAEWVVTDHAGESNAEIGRLVAGRFSALGRSDASGADNSEGARARRVAKSLAPSSDWGLGPLLRRPARGEPLAKAA